LRLAVGVAGPCAPAVVRIAPARDRSIFPRGRRADERPLFRRRPSGSRSSRPPGTRSSEPFFPRRPGPPRDPPRVPGVGGDARNADALAVHRPSFRTGTPRPSAAAAALSARTRSFGTRLQSMIARLPRQGAIGSWRSVRASAQPRRWSCKTRGPTTRSSSWDG
jgi:hypothetical protein